MKEDYGDKNYSPTYQQRTIFSSLMNLDQQLNTLQEKLNTYSCSPTKETESSTTLDAQFKSRMARGEAPAEAPASLAPHLAGASLHALPKPSGGVRPTAVGESLRRLVGKLLCQAVKTEARSDPCRSGSLCRATLNVVFMWPGTGCTATLANLTKSSSAWIFAMPSTWSTGQPSSVLCRNWPHLLGGLVLFATLPASLLWWSTTAR